MCLCLHPWVTPSFPFSQGPPRQWENHSKGILREGVLCHYFHFQAEATSPGWGVHKTPHQHRNIPQTARTEFHLMELSWSGLGWRGP